MREKVREQMGEKANVGERKHKCGRRNERTNEWINKCTVGDKYSQRRDASEKTKCERKIK